MGYFINAGCDPESIKYSITPKTKKEMTGTLGMLGLIFSF
jgi:hypothetical protein